MADTAPKMLLRSEQTGGHIAIVELRAQAARRHRHDLDETCCVLEGVWSHHSEATSHDRR